MTADTTTTTAARATTRAVDSRPSAPFEARPWIDTGVMLVLSIIGIVGFASAFDSDSYLIAGLGGLVVGAGVALLSWRLGFGAVFTALTAVIAFFVLGSAIAVPSQAIAGFIPTLDSLASIAIGSVNGWADIVTLRAPVSLPDYVNAVPYLAGWLVALVCTTLAFRWLPRRRRTALRSAVLLVGPVALYVAGVLLGTNEPYFAAVRGIAFAVIGLIWLGWRRSRAERVSVVGHSTLLRQRIIGSATIVLIAVVVGAIGGTLLAPAPANRFVLREEVQPPFQPLNYSSPLSGFREYTKLKKEKTLFTVRGLQPDERIRLATMDSYDGILWNVAGAQFATDGSGSFNLVGRAIPRPPLLTAGARSTISITVDDYSDVWVPDVGYPTALDFTSGKADASNLRYNAATGTTVLTTGVAKGISYRETGVTQKVPDIDSLDNTPVANITLPPVRNLPDIVTSKALDIAGSEKSPAARMEKLTTTLATTGYLSHGTGSDAPSRAGHGADRMVDFFSASHLVGDQEQYASALALMARSFNYPARVVMGFAPKVSSKNAGPIDVKGSDVTAWVEVAFQGVGWVPFDPTPNDTDVPQTEIPQPQSVPQPQVRQPPRTQQQQDDLVTGVDIADSKSKDRKSLFGLPAWVVSLGIGILIPLLVIFVPLGIIAAIKLRRRRQRLRASGGDLAVAGAWDELLDQYTELGFGVPERTTRKLIARSLEAEFDGDGALGLGVIAATTDDAVFSGRKIESDDVAAAWDSADRAILAARSAVGRRRRLLARYRVSAARRRWSRVVTAARSRELSR